MTHTTNVEPTFTLTEKNPFPTIPLTTHHHKP